MSAKSFPPLPDHSKKKHQKRAINLSEETNAACGYEAEGIESTRPQRDKLISRWIELLPCYSLSSEVQMGVVEKRLLSDKSNKSIVPETSVNYRAKYVY